MDLCFAEIGRIIIAYNCKLAEMCHKGVHSMSFEKLIMFGDGNGFKL